MGKPITKEESEENIKDVQWFKENFPTKNKKPVGKTRILLAKILCNITEAIYKPEDIRQISNQWSGSENKKKGDLRMGCNIGCL